MTFQTKLISAAITLSLAGTAHAADDDMFTLSGFGTLGVTHSTEGQADVTPDIQGQHGAGASHRSTARLDSRFALQLDARFNDDFSAVVQAVSEYAVTESYKPEISLAHVKYRVNPALALRVGRITAPLYMLSEYQRVGYAFPGVRQPNEVYNYLIAMDGIEGVYAINAGEAVIGLQAFYGEVNSEIADVQDMHGASITVDHGDTTWRVGHVRGDVSYATPQISQLFDVYANVPSPAVQAIADRLDPRNMQGRFSSIGFRHDPGTWFIRAEAIEIDYTPSMNSKTAAGYVNAGIRRGNWTPSLTFAHLDTSDLVAPGAADPIGQLNYVVSRNNNSRHAVTAALRWDAMANVAFKLEASHVNNHAGSYGTLSNIQPGFQPGRSYNLLSASLDLVF